MVFLFSCFVKIRNSAVLLRIWSFLVFMRNLTVRTRFRDYWTGRIGSHQALIVNSFEFKALCAEVDEQAICDVICFAIVNGLCFVNIFKFFNCFQLNHYGILDKKINPVRSNVHLTIEYRHFLFALKCEPLKLHLNCQCPLVNHFLKAAPKRRVNRHCDRL